MEKSIVRNNPARKKVDGQKCRSAKTSHEIHITPTKPSTVAKGMLPA